MRAKVVHEAALDLPRGAGRCLRFFGFGTVYRIEPELEVRLNYQLGRLADLVQVLAHSDPLITDLNPDRSHYALGMGEAAVRVRFRVRNTPHREQVFEVIREQAFHFHVMSGK